MAHHRWTQKDIPSQRGKTVLTTGLGEMGYECALALSLAGGDVIMAGPSAKAGERTVRRIKACYSAAKVEHQHVELSSLESIRELADRLAQRRGKIDILINAANVVTPAVRHITSDGFELQFGANYIGHFALTAKLMPLLCRAARPRVVSVTSVMARGGRINFENLQAEAEYKPLFAYCQSKLACLIFAQELQRRSDAMDLGHHEPCHASRHLKNRALVQRARPVGRTRAGSKLSVAYVAIGRTWCSANAVCRDQSFGSGRGPLWTRRPGQHEGLPD